MGEKEPILYLKQKRKPYVNQGDLELHIAAKSQRRKTSGPRKTSRPINSLKWFCWKKEVLYRLWVVPADLRDPLKKGLECLKRVGML